MIAVAWLFVRTLCDCFKSRRRLEAEILVLRHQLNVLQRRAPRRLLLRWVDRALFIWLYRRCPRILDAVTIVRPETVVRWHRMGFAAYWRWKSRPRGGRPRIGKELCVPKTSSALIREQIRLSWLYDCAVPLSVRHSNRGADLKRKRRSSDSNSSCCGVTRRAGRG